MFGFQKLKILFSEMLFQEKPPHVSLINSIVLIA